MGVASERAFLNPLFAEAAAAGSGLHGLAVVVPEGAGAGADGGAATGHEAAVAANAERLQRLATLMKGTSARGLLRRQSQSVAGFARQRAESEARTATAQEFVRTRTLEKARPSAAAAAAGGADAAAAASSDAASSSAGAAVAGAAAESASAATAAAMASAEDSS
jgi:hypothetical protein